MNIAIVGSGYWGKNLVRNYHQLGALRLICDKNEVLLARFQEQYPDVETCLSINEVLSADDIEAVVIATPAETHFTLAREALLAGKHVFVEKPLVLEEDQAEELITISADNKLVLMVGHLLQYHPAFVRLKEIATSGELGRINYIYSARLNLGKIRREENILWSFAPHDISMILSLAGEEPENVLATGGNYLHQKIADVTTTHLEFPSWLRAHIFVSWLHPFKEQKLVVVGDRKMAVFDDTQPWSDKLVLYAHEIKWQNNVPVPARAQPERVGIPEAEPLRLECEHFLECISNGKQPLTDGREGLRVLRILKASQQSLDQNGKKIYLPPCAAGDRAEKKGLQEQTPLIAYESSRKPPSPSHRHHRGLPSVKDGFIHETAFIDDNVTIGPGTRIWHFSHVISGSKIGRECSIGQNVVIGPHATIGNRVKIQNNVSVYQGVVLEDGVFCGPSMVFTNVYNPRSYIPRKDEIRPTIVREGATLGANCTILCGHTIGRFAFVGAGAVVIDDVPDFALVAGNPAGLKGWMCRCGIRLHFEDDKATCDVCGKKYVKEENKVYEVE